MICAVYRSPKKQQTFLYVLKRDDFSSVPEALMSTFGTPQLVTLINLANRDKLAIADIDKLKQALLTQGFYLQLPPPTQDMLKQLRQDNGLNDID